MRAGAAAAGGPRATSAGDTSVEVRVELTPRSPLRLPATSLDAVYRTRRGVLHRLLHDEDGPVLVRACVLSSGRVLIGAQAASRPAAERAIGRMRRALGVDVDLAPFHALYRADPLIGAAIRRDPQMRVRGRPCGFEALLLAVCEQLIEFERAVAIERRIVRAFGTGDGAGMWDAPDAATVAGCAPARLQSMDLAAGRALTLVRAAREVARGRVMLDDPDPAVQERGWRRLRTVPGIGSWTVEMLALTGQGRLDVIPAGDLGFLKLVGRLQSGGDPRARATEQDVRMLFERFGEWKGLAGVYFMRAGGLAATAL